MTKIKTELPSINHCPFCSERAKVTTKFGMLDQYPTPNRTFVTCEVCKACGPVTETHPTREMERDVASEISAITRWNKRCIG